VASDGDARHVSLAVGAEPVRQRLEERDARPDGELGIVLENVASERDAGRFAGARQQPLAALDQRFRLDFVGFAPVARHQRAPLLGNPLQQ